MRTKQIVKLLAGIFATTALSFAHAGQQEEWAPGRVLVMPKAGLTNVEFNKILKEHNGKAYKFGQSNLHLMTVPANSERAVVEKLKNNPNIKFAELDKKVKLSATSNDPYFGSEYHLSKIGADVAWDTTQGAGVTIAILDSGVDPTHPDLLPNLVPGYNFYDNNTNTSDVCGHGTAVAGSAAAVTNNALGVAGVAGQAKIMPIRIAYNDPTTGCWGYYSTITSGLTYAADHGAKIANISYGGVAGSASIINAAQYMQSKGGLVFVSAGNDSTQSTTTPTASMIVVSATDQYDNKTSWSNYGDYVSLAAPGSYIYTTNNGGSYGAWNGTSFASPITAGVGALVMATNPALGYADVQNILFSTAVDLGTVGKDIYFGYGRVNAAAAVAAAKSYLPPVDSTPPVVSITSPTSSSSVSGNVAINLTATDNVGVTSVQLFVNGNSIAIDNTSPFAFSWDSTSVPNGMANIYVVAFDAAGNQAQSSNVSVNVANQTAPIVKDTTAPVVAIVNPVAGSVSGTVNVTANASDNSGSAGITQSIYIDNALVKTGTGSSVAYSWNTRKFAVGNHVITAVAKDKAGNQSSASVTVNRK
jgi:subtilisin family serine protease